MIINKSYIINVFKTILKDSSVLEDSISRLDDDLLKQQLKGIVNKNRKTVLEFIEEWDFKDTEFKKLPKFITDNIK
jgi:capsular polysaccharide biosynthesis protein